MAYHLSATDDGNLTSNTSWKVPSAGANTVQTSTATSTNTTTSYVYNAAAQDMTIAVGEVIEGVYLYCSRINTTGTITVAFSEDSGSTATREVTINASDLDINATWVFFKFSSPLTGDGGTDYALGVKGSSAGNVRFYRSSTTADWTRMFRTDQNPAAAPTSADILFINGEWTAAATCAEINIVMNDVVASGNDYGDVYILSGGVLSFDSSSAANPYLRLSGHLRIYGKLNIGTVANPIPSDSTATLFMDCASANQYRIYAYTLAEIVMQGTNSRVQTTTLTAECNSGQKVVTVTSTSGWASGDIIAVSGTIRSNSATRQSEKATIDTVDSATQVTVLANFTYTHNGTGSIRGHVINLTRNINVIAGSSTNVSDVNGTCTVLNISNVNFTYVAIAVNQNSASYSSTFSGIAITEYYAANSFYLRGSGAFDVDGVVIFDCGKSTASGSIVNFSYECTNLSAQNITIMKTYLTSSATNICFRGDCPFKVFKNIVIADYHCGGSSSTALFFGSYDTSGGNVMGDFDSIEVYGCYSSGIGMQYAACFSTEMKGVKCWRNYGYGFMTHNNTTTVERVFGDIVISNPLFFGNNDSDIFFNTATYFRSLTIFGGSFGGDATYGSTRFMTIGESSLASITIIGANLDSPVAHTGATIYMSSSYQAINIELINCSYTAGITGTPDYGYIKIHTSGSYSVTSTIGTIEEDATVRHTASGYSWKLTPLNANRKLMLPGVDTYARDNFRVAVNSGSAVTINAYVYKSADYNGNQPRLVGVGGLVADFGSAGTDVTDTMTVGTETWEQLTITDTPSEAGVVEFYLDCDGTAGSVYIDDITVSQA